MGVGLRWGGVALERSEGLEPCRLRRTVCLTTEDQCRILLRSIPAGRLEERHVGRSYVLCAMRCDAWNGRCRTRYCSLRRSSSKSRSTMLRPCKGRAGQAVIEPEHCNKFVQAIHLFNEQVRADFEKSFWVQEALSRNVIQFWNVTFRLNACTQCE